MRLQTATSPRLRSLLGGYSPDAEHGYVDPDAPAEIALSWWPDTGLEEMRNELPAAREALGDLSDDAAGIFLGGFTALPAGSTWGGWFEYLVGHAEEFFAHRRPQTIGSDGVNLPRTSRFLDKDVANAAATSVVRAHEARLREWSAQHDGTTRLHLYADLGRTVGTYLEQGEVSAYQAAGRDPALEPTRHEATACVVVMRRDPETGAPYVASAYPEATLAAQPRERYPDLPLLFGGYFGQDYGPLDANRWAAERNFATSTRSPVRERIAAQLTDLLTQDDTTIRHDIEALGSYVLPDATRRWVTGLHRRLTRLDW